MIDLKYMKDPFFNTSQEAFDNRKCPGEKNAFQYNRRLL